MPKIVFNAEENNWLDNVAYDEAGYLRSGEVGAVFQGQGQLESGEIIDVVIKIPLSKAKEYLILEEFQILSKLANATARLHHHAFTPLVQMGWRDNDQLPVLVMPLYKERLIDRVRKAIDEGKLIEADRLAVQAAIEFTCILDGLHQLGYTCIDRKVADLFLYAGADGHKSLVVIDWNLLQENTSDHRGIEIGVAIGQIWHELFLGRKSVGDVAPLDDARWQPIEQEVPGGVPGVGRRFILGQTLAADVSKRFGQDAAQLREALQTLDNLLTAQRLGENDFKPDLFKPHLALTSAEARAIGLDLMWRQKGADRQSELFARRNAAIQAAQSGQDADQLEQLATKTAEGDYKQTLEDIEVLQARADAALWGQLERWKLLIEALRDRDDRTADHLYQNRDALLDIWLGLDKIEWRYQSPDLLQRYETMLEEIISRMAQTADAREHLGRVLAEIKLRQQVLAFYTQKQPLQAQLERIDTIRQLLQQASYLSGINTPRREAGLLERVLDLQAEEEHLRARLDADKVIQRTVQEMTNLLMSNHQTEANHVYADQHNYLRGIGENDAAVRLERETRPLRELMTFERRIMAESRATSLDWKLVEATRLAKDGGVQHFKLEQKPFEWLAPELEQAIVRVMDACHYRTFSLVCHADTIPAYAALTRYRELIVQAFHKDREEFEHLLDDYRPLYHFYQKYFQPGPTGIAIPAATWPEILRKAREVNANMTDLIQLTEEEWQDMLNLSETLAQAKQYLNNLEQEFTQRAKGLKQNWGEQVDVLEEQMGKMQTEQRKRTQEVIRQAASAQVAHQISMGLAAAQVFKREEAQKALKAVEQLLNQNSQYLQPTGDKRTLGEQAESLRNAVVDLEHLPDAGYYAKAHEFLNLSQLPEDADAQMYHDFVTRLEQEARDSYLLRTLQERYWTVRIEKLRTERTYSPLADVVRREQQELAAQLQQVDSAFQKDNLEQVHNTLNQLRKVHSGDTLADVLAVELIRAWEVRLANYEACQGTIDEIRASLFSPAEVMNTDGYAALLDWLVWTMRQCPPDAFNEALRQRWDGCFMEVVGRYKDSDPKISKTFNPALFEPYRREAQEKASKIKAFTSDTSRSTILTPRNRAR